MKQRKLSFKWIYLIWLGVLIALVAAALFYVRSLLDRYETSQPEYQVRIAVDQLSARAADGTFADTYSLDPVTPGPFEQGRDIQQEYLALLADREGLTVAQAPGSAQSDTLEYRVKHGDNVLALVGLRALSEPETKLAVLTMQDWTVDYVRPQLEGQDYTLTVPSAFQVTLNGTPMTDRTEADGESTYTARGIYLAPDFSISDETGKRADYTLRGGKVLVEYFHYALLLPDALTLRVNGEVWPGRSGETGMQTDLVYYEIARLDEPQVVISDGYGNEINYTGGDELPLTRCSITADERYTVQVDGAAVPESFITRRDNPDYRYFTDYVDGLPQLCTYSIAVLREDAPVTVTDWQGDPVALEQGQDIYDLTGRADGSDQVPAEIAQQIDVLQVAQNWSLFMSNDLDFALIRDWLIPSSYQYDVARKYATGVDITFTSRHTLDDPPFTGNSVSNFSPITENCFSVDIRFVKHMRLWYGTPVDDYMNDRFYFVRHDDTNNGVDDPAWKLVSIKEILDDADE